MNTISTYMRMLRSVFNQGVSEGKCKANPALFKNVYTGVTSPVKRALSQEDLSRIARCEKKLPEKLEKTRALFVLLFMLRGISFVDLIHLRRCDLKNSVVSYRRQKTGRFLTVKIEPEAMAVIRRYASADTSSLYLFPFLTLRGAEGYKQYQNSLRSFNYSLAKLALKLNIKGNLSSYSARHSWATIANYRCYDKELISNAMGHSSVKVTETYFKSFDDCKIENMNRRIISHMFEAN